MWNQLIAVRDSTNNPQVKEQAEMLLSQINTASGSALLKKEITSFLNSINPPVKTMTTQPAVQDIINSCTLSGNVIKLPYGQLDKDTYKQIANKFQKIGGKWNTKEQGFKFKHDPARLLNQLKSGSVVNFKKDFQFFATPDSLADYLVEHAYLHDEATVLEPSAGHGAIISAIHRQFPSLTVDYCEVAPECQQILSTIDNTRFVGEDFTSTTLDRYDVIVANPPFTKNQDIDHVRRMFECLNETGMLVSVMSRSWLSRSTKKETEFREWLANQNFTIEMIEAGEFKESGTMFPTCFVTISKRPKYKVDYHTGATSYAVNDLLLTVESTQNLHNQLTTLFANSVNNESRLSKRLSDFVQTAKRQYINEYRDSCAHIQLMTKEQDKEYTNLLLADFENWKAENE